MPNLPSRDFLQNLDIKEGETINMDCPKCDGVKKFSVSNLDGMLLYNCYRASCDVKGSFLTNMLVDTIKQKLSLYPMVSRETMELVCLLMIICSIWTMILAITQSP